jgi:hypothetical protein
MSKKNKKKKIDKLIKEVERKREVGFTSLLTGSPLITEDINGSLDVSTAKTLDNFIDKWKNKNICILLRTFFNEYMNQDYGIEILRWNYTAEDEFKVNIIINLVNKKDEDERISFYMILAYSANECFRISTDGIKKKGKYCFMIDRTKKYRDSKTKYKMENQVQAFTYVDEL